MNDRWPSYLTRIFRIIMLVGFCRRFGVNFQFNWKLKHTENEQNEINAITFELANDIGDRGVVVYLCLGSPLPFATNDKIE